MNHFWPDVGAGVVIPSQKETQGQSVEQPRAS
jgi:hypothetical protein